MNVDTIKENLKRGTIDLIILSLLQESDKYGYQLRRELVERSFNKYDLKEATMYPTLYRLVDHGFLQDSEVKVGKRRTRIYYHLTEKGSEYLQELRKEYLTMTEAIKHVLDYEETTSPEEEEKNSDNEMAE